MDHRPRAAAGWLPDQLVPAEQRRQIVAAQSDSGVDDELVTYPAAGHGFLCDRRASYVAAAAEDAWQRIHQLLKPPDAECGTGGPLGREPIVGWDEQGVGEVRGRRG